MLGEQKAPEPIKPGVYRALNRDGTDNLDRSQLRRGLDDLYHVMLSLRWSSFILRTVGVYIFINVIFGYLYFVAGADGLEGVGAKSGFKLFEECFFFSIQTFSTIGYGRLSPIGLSANILASIEAFIGMLSVAVMSGLLFARFSRPTARVLFSANALVTQHEGRTCLLFRAANSRLNQLIDARLEVSMMRKTLTPEGTTIRKFTDLPMMRSRSLFFSASWLAAHVIDEQSPFMHMTPQDLIDQEVEIFVLITGYDQTFSQTIHARTSYHSVEILWNRRFQDMLFRREGKLFVDLKKISELEPVAAL